MIGRTISHYRILEKLGGGGMGVVYKAEDLTLGRPVALKFLPEELSRDPQAMERFRREARTASALNHPGIVTIHEIGEDPAEGRAYIVMEYVEGQSLRQALAPGALPLDRALEVACQAAETLACAHEHGIVHRDLKPDNIMLAATGHAKVLDFGLAKLIQPPGEETREAVTRPGTVMGTVTYMSPEQVSGEPADYRSDIFSFGLVLFEMFTGRRAFAGKAVDVMHSIVHEPLPAVNDGGAPGRPPALGLQLSGLRARF